MHWVALWAYLLNFDSFQTLKHPNIVRLYDVIETDKYIGIILEYASGGELFDHILAHRYLRERDAAKLFSQLISGVWYIHQKKIVHRDLKLENLLLDRHRNVIITDFGFANRFEHRSDDLMQTSCGSPCYAAPELVISEGLYVGSAVDIWSCGVILYAMLAGYLPFDDDPANPDGDNINLLYKYIVSTPLSFPDYISMEARDLLGLMLVPDPTRRTTLDGVMRHPWLSAYQNTRTDGIPNAFGKTVDELEKAAMEQHQQKRQAYQRQMRAAAVANGAPSPSRTQSHRAEATVPPSSNRSRSTQPEYLYDSSVDQSIMSPGAASANTTPVQNGVPRKTYGSPAALGLAEDDPFAGPGGSATNNTATAPSSSTAITSKPRTSEDAARANAALSPTSQSKGHKSSSSGGAGFRHTIQVEYDDPSKNTRRSDDKRRERTGSQGQSSAPPPPKQPQQNGTSAPPIPAVVPPTPTKERRPSQSGSKPLPPSPPTAAPSSYRGPPPKSAPLPSPNNATPTKARPTELNGIHHSPPPPPEVSISAPPATPSTSEDRDKDTGSQNSASSVKAGHKRGKSSLDRIGLSKIFGSGFGGGGTAAPPVSSPINGDGTTSSQHGSAAVTPVPSEGRGSTTSVLLSPQGADKEKDSGKKSRRNTLTVMVEPLSRTIRGRKGRQGSTPMTSDGASVANGGKLSTKTSVSPQPKSAALPTGTTATTAGPDSAFSPSQDLDSAGMQASSNKAKKVMQWFRTKSKGRDSVGYGVEDEKKENGTSKYRKGFSASSSTINQTAPSSALGLAESAMSPQVVVTNTSSTTPRPAPIPGHPKRSASTATDASVATPSFIAKFRNSVTAGGASSSRDRDHQPASTDKSNPHGQLRIHHGAVDQTTITTRPPPEVMAHVRKVLEGMGVEIQLESEYKYRCIRAKKRKGTIGHAAGATVATSSASSTSGNTNTGSSSPTSGAGLAAVTMVGSAASNGVSVL